MPSTTSTFSFIFLFWNLFVLKWEMLNAFRINRLSPLTGGISRLNRLPKTFATMKDIVVAKQSSFWTKQKKPQFVFVGGKGGVGKTTTSSAVALTCSDNNLSTLVVSTDPAHSLGDCLDADLSDGLIKQIPTETNLWALEIDIKQGMKGFQQIMNFDPDTLSKQIGLPKEVFNMIDFEDIVKLFKNPPPGIDEVFALTKIFEFIDPKNRLQFDRIVIDTAPTGHTLRLLQIPSFITNTATKLLKLRAQVDRMMTMFGSLFGGNRDNAEAAKKVVQMFEKIELLQKNIQMLLKIIKDAEQTQFIVVTIPTFVALQETKRLLNSLERATIEVSSIVCNQIIFPDINQLYLNNRAENQKLWIEHMRSFLNVSGHQEVEITEVPYVSNEITTVFGLKYFQNIIHPISKESAHSATNPINSKKLTIFGGKGGVGKSTSSSSWAVRLSEAGFKTLLVSTDPAHSLSDVFRESFKDTPTRIDMNSQSPEEGGLWVLEIDPMKAMEEFKNSTTKDLTGSNDNAIMNLLFDPHDPPPGIDELAAISKVISFLQDGYTTPSGEKIQFERIVLDTAPTGHTLRMLEVPQFMESFLNTLRKSSAKFSAMGSLLQQQQQQRPGGVDPVEQQRQQHLFQQKIGELQIRMKQFSDMLHNPKQTEFTIVTIPTELATAETKRLFQSLENQNVLIRRIIMNQIISGNESEKYIEDLQKGQSVILKELNEISEEKKIPLIKIPYFPTEMRTVYALRHVGKNIFPEIEYQE